MVRYKRLHWILVALSCSAISETPVRAQFNTTDSLDDNARELLRQYAKHYDELVSYYTHCELEATAECGYGKASSLSRTENYRARYIAKGLSNIRIDRYPLDGSGDEPSQQVLALSSKGFFSAAMNDNKQKMALHGITTDRKRGRDTIGKFAFVHAPFSVVIWSVNELLGENGLNPIRDLAIDSVVPKGDNVIIRAQGVGNNDKPTTAEIVVVPKLNWAISEYSLGDTDMSAPGAQRYRARVQYDGEDGPIPLVSRVEHWLEVASLNEPANPCSYAIQHIRPAKIKASEFQPPAVGIDMEYPEPGISLAVIRWLIALCGIGLVAVYAIYYKQQRS